VIGPSNTPLVTDPQAAQQNVELAVLSAIEHGQHSDVALAARVVSAAIAATANADPERYRLYSDLILLILANKAPEVLKTTMTNLLGYEYDPEFFETEFARECIAKGVTRGRVEVVLKQLALRFGPPTESDRIRVRNAGETQLDAITERVITAATLEEALSPLS
jgi:hypothetical protein